MSCTPAADRYEHMVYRRCGNSGIKLPSVSLGLWQNFGGVNAYENARQVLRRAFDLGVTHFDLANNYGPPPGSAELTFGRVLKDTFRSHRDELLISTKAGFYMWDGPYGEWGSRKYLVSSLDQSLMRMGLDYVDIFYHHRPDPETPLEETMMALDHIVRQGKALYVGISNYNAEQTAKAIAILRDLGTPLLIHQPSYSMLNRWVEQDGLLGTLEDAGVGCIAYSPLQQGLLTDRYLEGIPSDSRAGRDSPWFKPEHVTSEALDKVRKLAAIAHDRGQTLAQLALAWVLRRGRVTSVLVGASRVSQLEDSVGTIRNLEFTEAELQRIESILQSE